MAEKKSKKYAKKGDEKITLGSKEIAEQGEGEFEKNLALHAKRLFTAAKETRRKYDWEWLVRNLFIRGYHFARYNRGTQTVVFANRSGVRIPINLLWSSMRAVRNQVTSFRPKWEVLPAVSTESAFENARYSSKVLDYIYEKSHIKRGIKEVVSQALLYSIGVWQFDVDNEGNIFIRTVDPYDFYIDPNVRSADINDPEYGAEYVVKTMSLPLDVVKKNPLYQNTETLQGSDEPVSASEYKRFLMQVTRYIYQRGEQTNPTVILKEVWMRERDEEGNLRLRVVTVTDSVERPLRNEVFEDADYPFEIYQGDLIPLEVYGESWAKHLIPLNRVIDYLESHIFEYNHLFARGRFVVDKNSGVRVIVNQHGQIIEKNRGSTVTSLDIEPLPAAPENQIARIRQYFEDISGAHDVSLGRIPVGVKSGIGIAELRQADATNQDDLVDNLEDFLGRAGRRILKIVAENWTTSKLVQVTGLGGKPEYFMAVSERSSLAKKGERERTFGTMRLPLAIIGAHNEVRVRVGSWLAYTKQARQEEIKELYRLGAIDQQTLLEHLEFGDIDGVVNRTREERLLQLRSGIPSSSVARLTGSEMDDEELALAENDLMLEGKDQPVEPDDDHQVHMAIHRQIQEDRRYGDLVIAHINEHINMMRMGGKLESQALPEGMQASVKRGNGQVEVAPVERPTFEDALTAGLATGGGEV